MANCYLLYDEESRHGVVVDPGADRTGCCPGSRSWGFSWRRYLLTHAHFDHIGAVEPVRERPGPPFTFIAPKGIGLRIPRKTDPACGRAWNRPLPGGGPLSRRWRVPDLFRTNLSGAAHPGTFAGQCHLCSRRIGGQRRCAVCRIDRTDRPSRRGFRHPDAFHPRSTDGFARGNPGLSGHGPETTIGREQESNPFLHGFRVINLHGRVHEGRE